MTRTLPLRLAAALLTLSVALPLLADDPDDAVWTPVTKAFAAYDADSPKLHERMMKQFDAREKPLRAKGNQAEIERLNDEREAYQKYGTLPAWTPPAAAAPFVAARAKVSRALEAAAKNYTRKKEDEKAAQAQKRLALWQAYYSTKESEVEAIDPEEAGKHLGQDVIVLMDVRSYGLSPMGFSDLNSKPDYKDAGNLMLRIEEDIARKLAARGMPVGRFFMGKRVIGRGKVEELLFTGGEKVFSVRIKEFADLTLVGPSPR